MARALVTGRVQGVGFRWRTRTLACELGLRGWCANLPDGRVEVWCEGDAQRVEQLLAWLRRGPSPARVDSLHVERGADVVALAPEHARLAF